MTDTGVSITGTSGFVPVHLFMEDWTEPDPYYDLCHYYDTEITVVTSSPFVAEAVQEILEDYT